MKKLIPILLLAGSTFLAGCGDSNDFNQVSGQQGNPGQVIPLAPVANNDVYATDEDDALTVTAAQGVLANDQTNTADPNAVTVVFPATTAEGGTLTQTTNTGVFTYTPALGFVGTDSFTYTLGNGFQTDTATVTIEVDAAVVTQGYFVDPAGNDTTGDFNSGLPYATIQGAVVDAPVNATITVRHGNYTGAVTLKDGQTLRGVANSTRPVLSGPIVLADGNTVDFLRVAGTNGNAIDGDDQTDGALLNCEIADTANLGNGLQAFSIQGTWRVENNVISNVAGLGLEFRLDGAQTATVFVNENTITSSAFNAIGFLTSGTSQLKAQVNGNVLADNQDGFTFEVVAGDASTASFQILDNQNTDAYRMSVVSTATTAAIFVEQLSQLISLNNDTGTITTSGGGGSPATEIPANSIDF